MNIYNIAYRGCNIRKQSKVKLNGEKKRKKHDYFRERNCFVSEPQTAEWLQNYC